MPSCCSLAGCSAEAAQLTLALKLDACTAVQAAKQEEADMHEGPLSHCRPFEIKPQGHRQCMTWYTWMTTSLTTQASGMSQAACSADVGSAADNPSTSPALACSGKSCSAAISTLDSCWG